ncbi:hypothetical protein PVAND_000408 [Polypedilum vanderplanki]|uniref:Transposase n=1 Tax=Polypedilum vanderplanki TaxID=319348 RepID=A0A9J6BL74_POLVA|nr:hypothetical protein PVAND_000408 [Polypedilum vanderplanki]
MSSVLKIFFLGSGAKNTFDDSYLELIVKSNPTMTLTEYADLFGVTKSCISKRLKALDYTSKISYWRKKSGRSVGATPGNISKAALHPKKIMLCLWWDIHGVIYYELLPPNETINAQKYQAQLKSLKEALALKRPALLNRNKVHFHHDNARPHTARDTVALLKSLQNALNGKNFQNKAELETFLNEFFDNKPNGYYKTGIYKLPELWKNVSENGGAYL